MNNDNPQTPVEFIAQCWREYVERTCDDLRAGLAKLQREPNPQDDADLAALLKG